MNYPQTSLSAAGVRDGNIGSVAYSQMTDGRFARTDNNSSPVSNVSLILYFFFFFKTFLYIFFDLGLEHYVTTS